MPHTMLVGVSRTGEELTDLAGGTLKNIQWLVHLDPVQYKDVAYFLFLFFLCSFLISNNYICQLIYLL